MTDNGLSACTVTEHGVLQFCPLDNVAVAPAGEDSNATESVGGAGLKASKFIQSGVDEHPANRRPPPRTKTTRYMILSSPVSRSCLIQF